MAATTIITINDRMKNMFILAGILITAVVLLTGCTEQQGGQNQGFQEQTNQEQTQPGQMGGPDARQRAMPQEAIDACSGKANGTVCEYSADGRTLNGTCRNMPSGQTVCLGGGRGGGFAGNRTAMASESVDACSGKAEGDVCSFTMNDRTIDGTCASRNGQMGCMSAGRIGSRPNGQ